MFNLRPKAEHTAAQIPDIKALAEQSAFHILHGANPQRKAGSGETFWQFREYRPGDLPREIDWRQSAKTDRVYIRQHERHSAQSCIFWLKQNADMAFKSPSAPYDKRSAAAILALTLALLHSRSGDMIAACDLQRPGHSEKTLQRFERLIMEERPETLPENLPLPRRAQFYALSDFWEPLEDIEAALSPLAGRTQAGCLIQILDPAELELPYQGRIIFEDMKSEAGYKTPIENAADIREAYQKRITAHNEALRALCTKWGWRYHLHRTDTPPAETLRPLWLEERLESAS